MVRIGLHWLEFYLELRYSQGVRDKMQNALVRLCTEADRLQRFEQAPDQALEDLDLDARERSALAQIPHEALERYARSLVDKRYAELERAVPLTAKISPRLRRHHRRILDRGALRAADTILSPGSFQALTLLTELREALTLDESAPDYAADLFTFETLRACSAEDGTPRQAKLRFAMHTLVADMKEGLLTVDPPLEPTRYRFSQKRIEWGPA